MGPLVYILLGLGGVYLVTRKDSSSKPAPPLPYQQATGYPPGPYQQPPAQGGAPGVPTPGGMTTNAYGASQGGGGTDYSPYITAGAQAIGGLASLFSSFKSDGQNGGGGFSSDGMFSDGAAGGSMNSAGYTNFGFGDSSSSSGDQLGGYSAGWTDPAPDGADYNYSYV